MNLSLVPVKKFPYMRAAFAAAALAAVLIAQPDTANAVPLFGNFTTPVNPDPALATRVGFAGGKSVRFNTGDIALTITSLQASLSQTDATPGTINFSLYSDNGGNPGTSLFSFGSLQITAAPTQPVDYLFDPGASFLLQPLTTYHIFADVLTNERVNWHRANPNTAPSAQNGSRIAFQEYRILSNGVYSTSNVGNRFQLNGNAITVPEPGTFAFVVPALGLIAATVARRKRK